MEFGFAFLTLSDADHLKGLNLKSLFASCDTGFQTPVVKSVPPVVTNSEQLTPFPLEFSEAGLICEHRCMKCFIHIKLDS